MAGKRHDAAGRYGPHDATANDGPNGNTGTSPAAIADNAPGHTAHDATAATAAMGDEFQ